MSNAAELVDSYNDRLDEINARVEELLCEIKSLKTDNRTAVKMLQAAHASKRQINYQKASLIAKKAMEQPEEVAKKSNEKLLVLLEELKDLLAEGAIVEAQLEAAHSELEVEESEYV